MAKQHDAPSILQKYDGYIAPVLIAITAALIGIYSGLEIEKFRSKTEDQFTRENREMLKIIFNRDREELIKKYEDKLKDQERHFKDVIVTRVAQARSEEQIKCLHKE